MLFRENNESYFLILLEEASPLPQRLGNYILCLFLERISATLEKYILLQNTSSLKIEISF